jgi:hypothetical protein
MDTYHAAFWSSDPSRFSSSKEEDEIPYIATWLLLTTSLRTIVVRWFTLTLIYMQLKSIKK